MSAALCPWMVRHPEVKSQVEQFILQFVTPELNAPEGYLRAVVSAPPPPSLIFLLYFFWS